MNFEKLKSHKSFGGETVFCSHPSQETKTEMKFSYFKPEGDEVEFALLWLSGLTCTEENFISKSGVQSLLGNTKTMVICPDTSPRGLDLPGEHDSYDFGSGAGFYLDATTVGYKDHYRMESYLLNELMPLIEGEFSPKKWSLFGHSMGGHGALTLGLKYPEKFHRVSAFSPIVNPLAVPWGEKVFKGYLGDDKESWMNYDSCELLKSGHKHPQEILIDQGLSDEFFENQLKTPHLVSASEEASQPVKVQYREGYDHSYYFIATFLRDHIDHLTQEML